MAIIKDEKLSKWQIESLAEIKRFSNDELIEETLFEASVIDVSTNMDEDNWRLNELKNELYKRLDKWLKEE